MIDLTTISLLRIKGLLNTPEKCEIFHRYTPLIVEKQISPKKILDILTRGGDVKKDLKNLLGEKAGP